MLLELLLIFRLLCDLIQLVLRIHLIFLLFIILLLIEIKFYNVLTRHAKWQQRGQQEESLSGYQAAVAVGHSV